MTLAALLVQARSGTLTDSIADDPSNMLENDVNVLDRIFVADHSASLVKVFNKMGQFQYSFSLPILSITTIPTVFLSVVCYEDAVIEYIDKYGSLISHTVYGTIDGTSYSDTLGASQIKITSFIGSSKDMSTEFIIPAGCYFTFASIQEGSIALSVHQDTVSFSASEAYTNGVLVDSSFAESAGLLIGSEETTLFTALNGSAIELTLSQKPISAYYAPGLPWGICTWDYRLFITDDRWSIAYATDYSGAIMYVFGPNELVRPRGICTDGDFIYVANYGGSNMCVFTMSGVFVGSISSFQGSTFDRPEYISVDSLYVTMTDAGTSKTYVMPKYLVSGSPFILSQYRMATASMTAVRPTIYAKSPMETIASCSGAGFSISTPMVSIGISFGAYTSTSLPSHTMSMSFGSIASGHTPMCFGGAGMVEYVNKPHGPMFTASISAGSSEVATYAKPTASARSYLNYQGSMYGVVPMSTGQLSVPAFVYSKSFPLKGKMGAGAISSFSVPMYTTDIRSVGNKVMAKYMMFKGLMASGKSVIIGSDGSLYLVDRTTISGHVPMVVMTDTVYANMAITKTIITSDEAYTWQP